MKASVLIKELTELMEKHGDLDVGYEGDNNMVNGIEYEAHSWIVSKNPLGDDYPPGFIMYEYY